MNLSFLNMTSGLDSRVTLLLALAKNGRKNVKRSGFLTSVSKIWDYCALQTASAVFCEKKKDCLLKKLREYSISLFSSWRSTHLRILRTLRIPVTVQNTNLNLWFPTLSEHGRLSPHSLIPWKPSNTFWKTVLQNASLWKRLAILGGSTLLLLQSLPSVIFLSPLSRLFN